MQQCWDCIHFERDGLEEWRGACEDLQEAVEHDYGVRLAGPVLVRSDSPACDGFEPGNLASPVTWRAWDDEEMVWENQADRLHSLLREEGF